MSRLIEFRGFNPVNEQFSYADINDSDEISSWVTWDYPEDSPTNSGTHWDVEQFTGLLDCNGVKIFEGDIAKATCGHVGKVMFSGASFYVDNYDSGDYYQGQNPDSWDWSKFEVIGNIHQNSELLK